MLEYSMALRLLTELHLEFLSFRKGCTGSSESSLYKMPHCWKSHVAARIYRIMVKIGKIYHSEALQRRSIKKIPIFLFLNNSI